MSSGLLHRTQAPGAGDGKPKRRLVLIIVAGFTGVVLLAALVFAVLPTSSPVSNNTPLVQWSAPTNAAGEPASGVCNFPTAPGTDVSTVIPADVTWNLTGGTMATPSAPSAGPLRSGPGGMGQCFARTPSGALLAISNLISALNNKNLDMNLVVSDRVSHSTGYEALNQRVQQWAATDHPDAQGIVRQIAGFRLLSFSADNVVIEIVQRNTSGASAGVMASILYTLTWEADDWKLVPPIDGEDLLSLPVPTLYTPYIPFNGA